MSSAEKMVHIDNLADLRASLRISISELVNHSGVSRSTIYNAEQGRPIKDILALKIIDSLLDLADQYEIDRRSSAIQELINLKELLSNRHLTRKGDGVPLILKAARSGLDNFFSTSGYQRISRDQRIDLRKYLIEKLSKLEDFEGRHPQFNKIHVEISSVSWRGLKCIVLLSIPEENLILDIRINSKNPESTVLIEPKEFSPAGSATVEVSSDYPVGSEAMLVVINETGIIAEMPIKIGRAVNGV